MTGLIDRYGKKDGVRFGEMPDPELRDDDVLVQVHAAGVNLLDSKIRKRKTSNSFCLIAYRSFCNDVAGQELFVLSAGSQ